MSIISGGGGDQPDFGLRPPTPDEYRRMWEAQAAQMKPNEIARQSEANKREARTQVFREAVQKAVSVKDERLVQSFMGSINIKDEPAKKKRRK